MASERTVHPAVELRGLRFGWRPGETLLELDEFRVEHGERVFLHGASGSGKSTLLGLIGGVLEPAEGSVRLLGQDLGALGRAGRDAFRAAHVGFIFQLFNLVPYLSVVENVLLPLRFSAARRARVENPRVEAQRLLRALGLDDDGLLVRNATALSVGQQQRVAAARALLGRPEVLIADEPTSALDVDAREAFLRLVMREVTTAGTALLFVSHDASLGRSFDRCVSLPAINRMHHDDVAA